MASDGVFFDIMSTIKLELVCWNVRGLNSPTKKKALREFADSVHPAIFCIQETKLACIDTYTVMQCLGPSYDGYYYLPATDTRGGILLAWNAALTNIMNFVRDTHCITGYISPSLRQE